METDEMTVSQSLRDEAKGYNETGISISPNVAIMAADTIDALVAALEEIGRKSKDATTFHEGGVNSSAMFSDISILVDAALALARKGGNDDS